MFVRLGAEAGTQVLLGMSPENLVVKPLPGEAALFDPAKYSSHPKKRADAGGKPNPSFNVCITIALKFNHLDYNASQQKMRVGNFSPVHTLSFHMLQWGRGSSRQSSGDSAYLASSTSCANTQENVEQR